MDIDFFQRQLFFHTRFITYLLNPPQRAENCIKPSIFLEDFGQEGDAMVVVNLRLEALRKRTEAVLNMVGQVSERM